MTRILYGIPNCDTVRRARSWLAARPAEARFHDLRRDGLPAPLIADWCERLGWQSLLNTRGTTWRGLDEAQRLAVYDAGSAGALMQAHPSLVRRPVFAWADGAVTVGFDADIWTQRLDAGG